MPSQEPVGPDRVSLLRLHELVPAAEELDLADEAHREQGAVGLSPVDREALFPSDAAGADVVGDGGADPTAEEPLSEGQVRGLLEHQLGATPLPAEEADSVDDGTGVDSPEPGRGD